MPQSLAAVPNFGISLERNYENSKPHTSRPTTPAEVLGMYSCHVCRLAQCVGMTCVADTCSILSLEVVHDASKPREGKGGDVQSRQNVSLREEPGLQKAGLRLSKGSCAVD